MRGLVALFIEVGVELVKPGECHLERRVFDDGKNGACGPDRRIILRDKKCLIRQFEDIFDRLSHPGIGGNAPYKRNGGS